MLSDFLSISQKGYKAAYKTQTKFYYTLTLCIEQYTVRILDCALSRDEKILCNNIL